METVKVVLYYADWCPHCMQVKPVFEQLKQKFKDNENIQFESYEDSQIKTMSNPPQIEGYPTIMIGKNDELTEYVGDRSLADITQKINKLIEVQNGGSIDEDLYKRKYLKYKKKYVALLRNELEKN